MIDARNELMTTAPKKRQSPRAKLTSRGAGRARLQRFQSQPLRSTRMGSAHGRDHRRRRQGRSSGRKTSKSPSPGRSWPPKVVVSKYFYGEQNTPERETSVRQLIHRVCRTIADWGVKDGYFSKADGEVFYDELTWLCVNQYGAFNSPVWFNVGLYHQYGVGNDSAPATGTTTQEAKAHAVERAPTQYDLPPVQRLLHPVGRRQHGIHHAPRPQRSHALQVRLRHRH
jgi:hypothetical protein